MQMSEKKVALYCRVAHMDQLAIELQKSGIERFAKSKGLVPYATYLDNGYSGLSDDRPAFQQMNADIANGKIDVVLMVGVSRIGRQVDKVRAWLRQVSQHNVQVIFSQEEGA